MCLKWDRPNNPSLVSVLIKKELRLFQLGLIHVYEYGQYFYARVFSHLIKIFMVISTTFLLLIHV